MVTRMNEEEVIYCQFCDEEVPYFASASCTIYREGGDGFSLNAYGKVDCKECGRTIIEGHGPYLDKLDRTI